MRCVESALNITIPDNARVIRNIISGMQQVQDHIIHFYHLHALDWVDVVSALKADPAKTSALAQSISDWHNSSAAYFKGVAAKLTEFVQRGQLGPFANAYWGHKAYKLPPEANLMAVAHYLEALEIQKDIIRLHATLGGKNPHLQTYVVGGMACPIDPNSQNAINAASIQFMKDLSARATAFVEQVYIPDLLAVASFYKDWAAIGEGVGNYLSAGDFPMDGLPNSTNNWLPGGVIKGKNLSKVETVDPKKIAEHVAHSWYTYSGGDEKGVHPYDGETSPKYTGPKPPYKELDTAAKYTWSKAPRYDDLPMEVGPLSRMLVAYAQGHKEVVEVVNLVLGKLGVGPAALFSTLGRTGARGVETLVIARKLPSMIDELAANIKKGDLAIANTTLWEPSTWPSECRGYGFHEAPRGMLSHWINIKDQKIANYQCIVPGTWNVSPRDAKGQRGPYEAALIGTPIENLEQPLEILRTVHSFDPCMACAVHVVDAQKNPVITVKVK